MRDTRLSMLERLKSSSDRDNFEFGWQQFYDKYHAAIRKWCMRKGLCESDAEDVMHDVLLRLVTIMRSFEYDPSERFQAWLKTVCNRTAIDYLKKHGRIQLEDGNVIDEIFTARDIEETLHTMMHRELLEIAQEKVENQLREAGNERDWQVYLAASNDELDGQQIANQFGIQRSYVYVIKNRVLKMLQQQIETH